MSGIELSAVSGRHLKGGRPHSIFVAGSPLVCSDSSTFSLPGNQVRAVILLLIFTGRRVSQILEMLHCDILDDDHLYFRSHKRGRPVTIPVPGFLINSLRLINPGNVFIFTVGYKLVYYHVVRSFPEVFFVPGKKNRAVTHAFRKKSIRRQLFDYRNDVKELCRYFGWEDKRSLVYYL